MKALSSQRVRDAVLRNEANIPCVINTAKKASLRLLGLARLCHQLANSLSLSVLCEKWSLSSGRRLGSCVRTRKAALAGGHVSDGDVNPSRRPDHGATEILPNVPARLLLGPAVKNNCLTPPFLPVPSPNPIPHNWSISIAFPF